MLNSFQEGLDFTMSQPFLVTEQKLAEKLTILKERGIGMLTRIYNIKKGTCLPRPTLLYVFIEPSPRPEMCTKYKISAL